MIRQSLSLLDEFLFGVAYSCAAPAPVAAAPRYHRVCRGLGSPPCLAALSDIIAVSVSTKT